MGQFGPQALDRNQGVGVSAFDSTQVTGKVDLAQAPDPEPGQEGEAVCPKVHAPGVG